MISTEKTRKHFTKLTIVKENPGDATPGLDWSSKKEHKADALALGADEGRDKLR